MFRRDLLIPSKLDSSGRNVLDSATTFTEWLTEVGMGNVAGYSVVHKFGAGVVGTSLVPIPDVRKTAPKLTIFNLWYND